MEVILATTFSRDVSAQKGTDHPLTTAAAAVIRTISSQSGSRIFEQLIMTLSHFPWMVGLLRKLARVSPAAKSYNYLEATALKTD